MPIATTFLAASNSFPSIHYKSTNSSSHPQFCIISKPLTSHQKITAAFNSMPEIALDRNDKRASTKASSISALEQLKISSADRYTKERSSIVLLGLNFHTAPLEMREKLAVPKDELPRAIEELCSLNHIEEAGVLSTCNRVEIYVLALSWHRGVREVMEWMAKTSGIPASQLRHHLLLLRDSDATKHLFQVSSGLDSLVLGEVQILAQIKQVLHCGNGVTGFGRHIGGLFQHASTVGGMVRDKTGIASGAVSISSAAVELAVLKLPEGSSETARVLVVGAGNMGRLVIKHLVAKGWTKIVVCNRSEERVAATREELKGVEITYRPFTEMLACAANADVIFTSTSLKTLLFLKENVDSLPPVCDAVGGLRLFIDISAPRNVSTCVADVANTRLYNVDDLKEVVAINKEDRRLKAMEAHSIIAEESRKFGAWRDSLETVPTIKKLRGLVDGIRKKEIDRCVAKLGNNISPKTKKAIEDLSLGIMNKMLHGPMQHLRCDDGDKRTLNEVLENMYALNRIFSLETNASILEQKVRAKLDRTRRETQ